MCKPLRGKKADQYSIIWQYQILIVLLQTIKSLTTNLKQNNNVETIKQTLRAQERDARESHSVW
jgi:hypothetical protein